MESAGMSTPDALSYISPIGYTQSAGCGYCGRRGKSQSKRYSYYASATSLRPSFYQKLLDRCWRRSGSLLYRPDQKRACCPHYTLRLDSSQFRPGRDQRQTVNRFNRHVTGDEYAKQAARLYPRSREEAKKRETQFDLVGRVHEAERKSLKAPPEPAHELTVTLEDDSFTEEKYLVYENYQRLVHREPPEDISRRGFRRFLCESPLRRESMKGSDGQERALGSFHQCYWLDGKLVAVGVLDLLPECVSAVYFFYHESIHRFSPGKLSALREIALAVEGGYRWWYPGYYIHSCPKMRYKMDYSPQYILDPETLEWDRVTDEVLQYLDKNPYLSLSRERAKAAGETEAEAEADVAETRDEAMSEDDRDGAWIFTTDMPGITPLSQMLDVDLDGIALRLDGSNRLYRTNDLVFWDSASVLDWPSFKAGVAELVAAIGPDLASEICLVGLAGGR